MLPTLTSSDLLVAAAGVPVMYYLMLREHREAIQERRAVNSVGLLGFYGHHSLSFLYLAYEPKHW